MAGLEKYREILHICYLLHEKYGAGCLVEIPDEDAPEYTKEMWGKRVRKETIKDFIKRRFNIVDIAVLKEYK